MIPMTQSPRNAGPVRQTVCLCMIVKNEAPVIARCLASVRPLITHWVIVDTGSTDGTQDIVRRELADLPGKLHERPWKDFAHNRSKALALARPHGDYSLVIDADDALELPAGTRLPLLSEDCYTLDIRDGALLYQRKQLVSNRLRWFYRGVLHEFIDSEGPHGTGHVEIVMRRNHDGARRRDPETYRRDAKILERALRSEADPFLKTRYTFYLAQSYRDCGEPEKAITHYLDRARLGGWQEEVFVSLY
uniref:glycosyltransferase n=1 Tax=Aestuariivirga sp. TaxID=2650926 RepID=UPI0035B3860B